MRITNPTMLRGYTRDLNNLMTQKNTSFNKITSGRSFMRASENPVAASKALRVRHALYNSAQYKENLKVANTFYTEAETSLLQVSEELQSVREYLTAAVNTYNSDTELSIYAQQVRSYADRLCEVFNTDSAQRLIFGGNCNQGKPFAIDGDTVTYLGVPVNAYSDPKMFPFSDEVYVDIGLGMLIDQETQEIDPQTALCISFNGAKVSGCGATGGSADIDLTSIIKDRNYTIDVYANDVKKTINFTGKDNMQDNVAAIRTAINDAYADEDFTPVVSDAGIISLDDAVVCIANSPKATNKLAFTNDYGYNKKFSVDFSTIYPDEEYTLRLGVDGNFKTVTFVGGATEDDSRAALQQALDETFGTTLTATLDDGSKVSFAPGTAADADAIVEALKAAYGDVPTGTTAFAAEFDGSAISDVSIDYDNTTGEATLNAASAATLMTELEAATTSPLAAGDYDITLTVGGKEQTVTVSYDGTALTLDNDSAEALAKTMRSQLGTLANGTDYNLTLDVGGTPKTVTVTAGATDADTAANIAAGIDGAKLNRSGPLVETNGVITKEGSSVVIADISDVENAVQGNREFEYSHNFIQLIVDASNALADNNFEYANACIDRIVNAASNVLLEIADVGCNEEFSDFMQERFVTRDLNLTERQKDLEAVDYEKEITYYKTFEAIYNAALQMASAIIPNSIFNYIK